jgi:hypothetical protein
VFNATFSNISAISWRPVLVVEEAGVPEEKLKKRRKKLIPLYLFNDMIDVCVYLVICYRYNHHTK